MSEAKRTLWLLAVVILLAITALQAAVQADAAKGVALASTRPLLSVYVGNEPASLSQFESWLGRKVDGFQVHTGPNGWKDWEGSIPWQIELWKNFDREIFWSIPLIPTGTELESAARGDNDRRYEAAARTLVAAYPHRDKIYVRVGWEFNGNWMPWSAIGRAETFVSAYRHFVDSFRRASTKFVFEWTPNIGDQGMNPEDAYPGDHYVDIIGLDFYYNKEYDPKDGRKAWTYMLKRAYGLEWFEGFVARHHKPSAYAEWGLMSNDTAGYVQEASRWFSKHRVVYQSYWNSNDAFQGKLSGNQFPATGRSYRKAFGRPSVNERVDMDASVVKTDKSR